MITLASSRRRALRLLVVSCLAVTAGAFCSQAEPAPRYLDTQVAQAERITDLISRMTLEEKASMMGNSTPGVPRLGIPRYDWWSEALHGVANAGHATVFPQAIGLAAMWDAPLQQEIASVTGVEGRAKFNSYKGTPMEGGLFHGLTFWSPNINIFRDPRWGRGQETYGEDPFLTARLGVAFVRGLQGEDPRYLLAAACAKHFAVHSGPEPLRHNFDATPPPADLYETYLPAFEALVREARVEAVMTAYNAINGIPASVNPFLYHQLELWGFDGHVTSDCGSVVDLHTTYRWGADAAEADALVFRAGMNVRCGSGTESILSAVQRGLLSEAEINKRLRPLLRTFFRLGFFDPAEQVPFNQISPAENDAPAHGQLALRAARESIVLLKNDGLLPLKAEGLHRVLVVGPNADSVPALVGNYNGEPSAPVTLLAGLRAALEKAGVVVEFAQGCDYASRPDTWRLIPQPWFRGEFFGNRELAGAPLADRTTRPLCVACTGVRMPYDLPSGIPSKDVSARWTGTLQTTLAGEYQFRVRGRGGFRLSLGDQLILDSWTPVAGEASQERSVVAVRQLPGNAALPIKLEYVQGDGAVQIALEWKTPRVEAFDEALAKAAKADVVIFAGGISAQLEGEEMQVDYDGYAGGDRLRIELPELQQQLLSRLKQTGKPLVYVNLSGSAIAMPWLADNADAILQAWYPGQAGGTAVADVVLGNYNPAGRLPLTFYRSTEDLPDFNTYDMAGRTYRYFKGKALFPFGHGLSYTQFAYSNLQVSVSPTGGLHVVAVLTNSGKRAGEEVVQLYLTPPAGARPGELRSLCGFRRVQLAAGESRTLEFEVPATSLRRWNGRTGSYATPTGAWTLSVGASSADLRLNASVGL
jgi:beta-glucosidase